MSAALVVDSSALVALLADAGKTGDWVAATIGDHELAAPELAMFEAANVIRRQQQSAALDSEQAALAHQGLLSLPVQLWPYLPLAGRAWELRESLTMYDASYVALAERLDTGLVTLDARLARAHGPRCPIRTP